MYALFKDGARIGDNYNSLIGIWIEAIALQQISIFGTINTEHLAAALKEGYTIEEVKE